MKNISFSIILFMVLSVLPLTALEVDRDELNSVASDTVVFINYTGPQSVIQTRSQIAEIGASIGRNVAVDPSKSGNFGNSSKYQVIHAVDPSQTDKLDADILIIGPNATVDHIKNLRTIISSYLVSAYDYSQSDADTLAVFITVYNAVYRGNLDAYSQKYKSVVVNNLTSDKAGLSVNYEEWAGKSQIVIPLAKIGGGLSTIDTSVISDKKVVDSMREDEDKGVTDRKNLVELKEREADKATEKAQTAQKKAVEEQKKLSTEKKVLDEKKQVLDEKKQVLAEAEKKLEKDPEDSETKKVVTEAKKVVEEQEKVVEKQEKLVEEQEEVTKKALDEATKEQMVADKKLAEAIEDRKEIAKDQKSVIAEAMKNAAVKNTAYGLKLTEDKNNDLLSTLVKMDADTGRIIKESPVTVIRNRIVYPEGENFIAIAGKTGGNATVKLVTLDGTNMEIIGESAQTIAEDSAIVTHNGSYFAVIANDDNYTLGKFNSDLTLEYSSKINVEPSTPIMVTEKGVVVTSSNGNLVLLNAKDLNQITE